MVRSALFLHGCRYVVGESEGSMDAMPGRSAFLAAHQMLDDRALWGWDRYRVSSRSAADLAAASARLTLDGFPGGADGIDAIVLCGARFPSDIDSHADVVGRFLDILELDRAVPYGATLNRCATLLSGLTIAEALVASGRHRAVLVAAADKVERPEERLRSFAVFSDGAASCVLAAEGPGEYTFVASAAAVERAGMTPEGEVSSDLICRVHVDLKDRIGVAVQDIRRLAHNNLFRPIVMMKEQQAGFRPDQLYLDNIGRIGHVFASDPMINLVDLTDVGAVDSGDVVALGSSVSGARFCALLRRS